MGTKGMHLGGLRTIADVYARSKEVGDCWEWQKGYQCHGTNPTTVYLGKRMGVRRAVVIMQGIHIPAKHRVLTHCGNAKCVNPEHLKVVHPSRAASIIAEKTRSPATRAKMSAARQAKSAITPDVVADIRNGTESNAKTAARHGIAASTVGAIRRGEMRPITMWAGLMRHAA